MLYRGYYKDVTSGNVRGEEKRIGDVVLDHVMSSAAADQFADIFINHYTEITGEMIDPLSKPRKIYYDAMDDMETVTLKSNRKRKRYIIIVREV